MMYSKETLQKVREKADIVAYLEKKGTPLRVTGASFVGLCPFHNEKSPSFNINPSVQRFRCFGCGETGDIFSLVQHMEALTFISAVQHVAESVDLLHELEEIDDEAYRKRKRLHSILQLSTDYYRERFLSLPDNHPAKTNLQQRDLLTFALTDKSIGYAPAGALTQMLLNGTKDPENANKVINQFTAFELYEVGLLKYPVDERGAPRFDQQPKEAFRNRLMWTIYDVAGKPIGFSGRVVDPADTMSPKYLNTGQTLFYNKSRALLGLNFARKSITDERAVILVEGQTDVMAFQAAGIQNVVASCGTAFGQQHVDVLARLASAGTKKGQQFTYIFCMDADNAGMKSVMSVFENIPEIQMSSKVVTLKDPNNPNELYRGDPCDFRMTYGDEALKQQIEESAVSIVEFALKRELEKWDALTPEGRTGFINAARPILGRIQDSLAHDAYLRKISFWTGVQYSELVDAVRHRKQYAPAQAPENAVAEVTIDEKIYAAFLQHPEAMTEAWIAEEIPTEFFTNQAEAEALILNLPEDSPYLFLPLNFPEGQEIDQSAKLLKMFLKIKYMEAVEQLNARMASASQDISSMDEMMLLQMITEQANLKKLYKQA